MDVSPQVWIGLGVMLAGFAAMAASFVMPAHKNWQKGVAMALMLAGGTVAIVGLIMVLDSMPEPPPQDRPTSPPYFCCLSL